MTVCWVLCLSPSNYQHVTGCLTVKVKVARQQGVSGGLAPCQAPVSWSLRESNSSISFFRRSNPKRSDLATTYSFIKLKQPGNKATQVSLCSLQMREVTRVFGSGCLRFWIKYEHHLWPNHTRTQGWDVKPVSCSP